MEVRRETKKGEREKGEREREGSGKTTEQASERDLRVWKSEEKLSEK